MKKSIVKISTHKDVKGVVSPFGGVITDSEGRKLKRVKSATIHITGNSTQLNTALVEFMCPELELELAVKYTLNAIVDYPTDYLHLLRDHIDVELKRREDV